MSTQHTPGRLVAEELDQDADYAFVIRQIDGDPYPLPVADCNRQADARRLVACWNACEDEDTDMLEAIVRDGTTIRRRHDEALRQKEQYQGELCDTERQRDELLAVLKQARGEVQYMASGMTHSAWRTKQAKDAMANIDAVIAKVEGGCNMSAQPDDLRLVDALLDGMGDEYWDQLRADAAAALCRLHAENDALRAALAEHQESLTFETAAEAKADREHAEAYYRQAEHLLTSNEQTLHAEIARLKAQLAEQPAEQSAEHWEPVATVTVNKAMGANFHFTRPHTLLPGQMLYVYTAPQPTIPPGYTMVNSGALQMVVNALRRDAAEGKAVRAEMADALTAAYDAKNDITGED